MNFVDFKYYDSTSDTPSIASVNVGTNEDRFAVLASVVAATVTINTLTLGGENLMPTSASGTGPSGFLLDAFAKTITGTGSLALASSATPVGVGKNYLLATFDGIASLRSAAAVGSGGVAGQPTATVTTVAGDVVVLMGNDLSIYDPTITPGSGATVLAGSGFFIALMKTATGTSTTINGTFSGGNRNWQGLVFVLTPTAGDPVITGPSGAAGAASSTANVAENATTGPTFTTDIALSGGYPTLTGTDASLWTLTTLSSTSWRVDPNPAKNFESPTDAGANNVHDVVFNASATVSQSCAITITNVNEAPVITSNGGGATASISIAENTTAVTTLTATDPDAGATLTWTISGGLDAAKFQITGGNLLRFITAPDFDVPGDSNGNNVYGVTVQVSDGTLTDSQDISVTVTNVTELPGAPTIGTAVAGNASASVTFTPPAAGTAPAVTSYTATSSPGGFTGTGAASPVTVSGLSNGTAYTFTVTATNPDGTGPASAASNSVTPAVGPTVNTHPTAQTAKIGATATFTAAATASSAPLTAQWQKDAVNISGATNTTSYARTGVVLGDHGALFRCTYSDAVGGPVFTNAAALTVAVTFINGPVPAQSGSVGSAASWDFSSFFAGGLARTFSVLLGALPAGMSQVGTTAVFSGTPTTAGSGTMVVSATDSATNSDLTGTISWTISSAGAAPAITVQPANQSVTAGATASFSVGATGSALTYQWRRNGTPISGATSSSYTTPTTTVSGGQANSGDLYSVVVTGDTAPAATSSNAELTVTPGLGATIISSVLKNNAGWVHALAPFRGYLRDVATGTQLLTKTGLTASQDGTIGFFDVSLAVGADYELRWDRTDTGERGWEIVRAI